MKNFIPLACLLLSFAATAADSGRRYDADNNQIYTNGQVLFDTVFRFKGQQAPAVILMDIDQRLSDSKRWQAVLYCGMTRAMVRLELLVQEGSGLQQRLAL